MFQSGDNVITIEGQDYNLEVTLFNSDFYVNIPYKNILNLTITETIYSTFPSGSIIIDNAEDMIESFSQRGTNEQGYGVHKSYNFDCTGRDMVLVKIQPLPGDRSKTQEIFPDHQYQLLYIFSVVSESVKHTSHNAAKVKVLQLMDAREFLLTENVSMWSTNDVMREEIDSSVNLSQKSNEDRKVKTGVAIKNFMKSVLPDAKFAGDWDTGKTKIFYSTPGTSSNMQTLLELLDSHVSEKSSDNCLLRLERDGHLSLRPFEEYCKGAVNKENKEVNGPGQYIIDAFTIPYQSGTETATNPREYEIDGDPPMEKFEDATYDVKDVNYTKPKDRLSYDLGAATWSDFDGMESYSFSHFDMAANIVELTSLPVHNTNIRHKQFNVDNKDNHIENIKTAFDKMYIEHFHGQGGKPKSIFPLNDKKRKNEVVNNLYSTSNSKDYRLKLGRNTIFNKVVNFAPALSFKTKGVTSRIAGRYVSLFGAPAADTKFQDIIQGEWFITHLVHSFSPGKYDNTITGIKFHSFK